MISYIIHKILRYKIISLVHKFFAFVNFLYYIVWETLNFFHRLYFYCLINHINLEYLKKEKECI